MTQQGLTANVTIPAGFVGAVGNTSGGGFFYPSFPCTNRNEPPIWGSTKSLTATTPEPIKPPPVHRSSPSVLTVGASRVQPWFFRPRYQGFLAGYFPDFPPSSPFPPKIPNSLFSQHTPLPPKIPNSLFSQDTPRPRRVKSTISIHHRHLSPPTITVRSQILRLHYHPPLLQLRLHHHLPTYCCQRDADSVKSWRVVDLLNKECACLLKLNSKDFGSEVMTIDKSWIWKHKTSIEFWDGLKAFLVRCKDHLNERGKCRCPCNDCNNMEWGTIKELECHIHSKGFCKGYQTWIFHGESYEPEIVEQAPQTTNQMRGVLNDVAWENIGNEHHTDNEENSNEPTEGPSSTNGDLDDLFTLADTPLYPGCDWISTEFNTALPGSDAQTTFPNWFREKINRMKVAAGTSHFSPEIHSLANGPMFANTYTACIVNGVRFVVHSRDTRRTTQNSGISTPGLEPGQTYYGVLEEILELTYMREHKVVLFRCKWFKTDNQRCVTKNNITSISTQYEWFKEDQYILTTQANQVFYLQDPSKRNDYWKVVQEVNHRKIWDRDIITEVSEDVIHDDNSNRHALSANLDDLTYTSLSTGHVMEVQDIPTAARPDNVDAIDDADMDISD
ncbi:hypothetical protein SSX86_032194 [Deinandra increscens subsp. villosa]|uniref:DUF4216 domain-containing protein n=1 Tax=Deinandra increscens subsp. villosa TaxID=3103831 RepID=A0AAP0GHZ8_9ASTR